jgi:hypothetical protein
MPVAPLSLLMIGESAEPVPVSGDKRDLER